MPLLVLAHVEPHHRVLVVEHELGERAGELGLADTRRAEEDERADRPVRVLEPGPRAPQRVRDGGHGLVLADHALMQPLLHVDQLLGLALEQTLDGDARPAGDDRRDVVLVDLLLHHRVLGRPRVALGELPLELGQVGRADLGDAREVARALGPLVLHPQLVDLRLDLADPLERLLLLRPAGRERVPLLLRLGERTLDRLAHRVGLLAHRRELDLELHHAPVRLVELDRRRLDLHLQPRRRLVDEVDRLVGQEAGRRCSDAESTAAATSAESRIVTRGGPRSAP